MHDDYIVQYNVKISEKRLIIQTYNSNEKKERIIRFDEVLTHSFKCIIDYNQLLDIAEYDLGSFIADNKSTLEELKGYCWPIDYQKEEDLLNYLLSNGYKYIKVNASFGLFGWILAKSFEIIDLV